MIGNDDSPLTETEVHRLRSDHVGDDFKILVGHCGEAGSGPQPVLFLGDAWMQFGTALETIRVLHLTKHLPAILVVAIGYFADLETSLDLRSRDFTPTLDPRYADDDPALMGGADRFLAFLRDELKPWVQDRFDVDADDSMYFGDSLGGLFASYVLFKEPATFQRYGIGSPSLWWDDEMMFGQEAAYAGTHDDLAAKVFVSVGGDETLEAHERFLAWLPETVPPLNLSRALRYLFDAPR